MRPQKTGSYDVQACRACKGAVRPFLDLGESPVANQLLTHPLDTAVRYPLGLSRCDTCTLVQNATSLPADLLFGPEYAYMSSVSVAVRDTAADLAKKVCGHVEHGALILDVGSNDGTLQRAFRDQGAVCIGIDPSEIPVKHARDTGLTAYCSAFDRTSAQTLTQTHGRFAAVTMSNVLAHVAAPYDMLLAARHALDPEHGLLVIEVQSWARLVALGAFDMVYHEHHAHFSLGSAAAVLTAAGFAIFDVEETSAQGGSLRLWCRQSGDHSDSVKALILQEKVQLKADEAQINDALRQCRNSAAQFLEQMKGRQIAGYGAAAKTVTLMAALKCDLAIHAIADKAPPKTGKFLPYGAIPILTPEQMMATRPQVVLIFAWNLTAEILPELEGCEAWVPFPDFHRVQ